MPPQLSTRVRRNQLMIRLDDIGLAFVDAQRGAEGRSTFIRKMVEAQAVRDLQKDGSDGDLSPSAN